MKNYEEYGRQMENAQGYYPSYGSDMSAGQNTSVQLYNRDQQNYNYNLPQNYNYGQQQYGGDRGSQIYGNTNSYQQPDYRYSYAKPGVSRRVNGLGIASLVCSILGIFFLPFILAPLAVIFGGVGISQCNKQPNVYSGKGLAIAGLVIGIVVLAFCLIGLLLLGSALSFLSMAL